MLINLKQENYLYKFSYLLIFLLPFSIVFSTVSMNILVVLLDISFISLLITQKKIILKTIFFLKIILKFFIFSII